ncbi:MULTISPECIES: flippase [Metabacillus]|uniref:flippase n=1 Tax=Metabacillus TaxID=2675233 RepID=UPI001E63CCB9|nr:MULTISPECIES: flippase [Metabacillus]
MKKNYLYNLMYKILTMILPLVTVPYVSRVLNPEGVGTYAYTLSIVQYFVIIGMLGIGTYGNKMVAMARDNKENLSKTFLSIYSLQFILTLSSVFFYLIFVYVFMQEFRMIALIQTIYLLSIVIDCTWFFSGLEQFKKVVTRDVLIKVLGLISIFTFVKNEDDLVIYTIIMSLSVLIGQLIMWFYVKEYIIFTSVSWNDIFRHIKPTFVYFLPQVAAQVYFVLNKTMIGIFSTTIEVGIFDYADKILKVALAVVTSLGVVMLPRMSNTFAKGDIVKAKVYINKSLDFTTLLAVPIMLGLAGIAKELIPWYMGEDFNRSIPVLIIISPTILLMAWSGVFGAQYMVPLGKMKEFTISLYAGAIVNLTVNLLLIKPFGSIGAAVGTLSAELAVTLVQLFYVRKEINVLLVIPKTIKYLISGIIMYILVRYIGNTLGSSMLVTFLQIVFGAIIYFTFVIIFEIISKDGLIINEIKKRWKK